MPIQVRSSHNSLELEAERIYQAIFRGNAPFVVKKRFIEVAARLNEKSSETEVDRCYTAIEKVSDLEALEVACRITGALPLLKTKFHVMVFLAETVPENQHYFTNEDSSVLRGWWTLVSGGLETALKLVKGIYLLRRLRNA